MEATRQMATSMLFVVLLCAHASALTQDDVGARLAKIEAALEKVLEQNQRLEKRVEALEEENMVLKRLLAQPQSDNTKPEEETIATEALQQKHRVYKHRGRINGNAVRVSDGSFKQRRQLTAATVAFTAVVSPPTLANVGKGQTVVYDKVITNVGKAYHNTTGIFTAPVAGSYAFTFSEMIDPGLNEYLELVKEGQHVMWNFGHANGASHLVSSTRTATMELQAGEQVWVRTSLSDYHGNGVIHGYDFTTLTGWLIAEYM